MLIRYGNIFKIFQIFFIVFVSLQNISITFFDYSFIDIVLIFSVVLTFTIYAYATRKILRHESSISTQNYPNFVYLLIVNQFALFVFYLFFTNHNSSDVVNLGSFYVLFENNNFVNGYVKLCSSVTCPAYSFYPLSSFSVVKLLNFFVADHIFVIKFITSLLALIIIPMQLLKFEYFFTKTVNKIRLVPVFFLIFNMTFLSSLVSTHLAFLFALSSLLFFLKLFFELFIEKNYFIKSKLYFSFFLFIMIFLFYAHPTILITFFILFLTLLFLYRSYFHTSMLLQFIAASIVLCIFVFFTLSQNVPLHEQFSAQLNANEVYFDKLFISNKDSSFYLLLKVFKLFFTNSYFNLISYLLFPLILLISFNIRRARVAVLLAFCLLLSLDNSFIRNLFNYFDLIPSTIERILIRIYTTITYGNYYRLNFVKSLLLFYMFLDFLKALPFSSKTNVLNIYLFLVYVLNLIFTFKMLLDLSN